MMLVDLDHGPFWMGREMDAGAARFTTYLTTDQITPYPETLVQRPDTHPAVFLADWMAKAGFANAKIGYESDVYYLSPRALAGLQDGMPKAVWVDADLLVQKLLNLFLQKYKRLFYKTLMIQQKFKQQLLNLLKLKVQLIRNL